MTTLPPKAVVEIHGPSDVGDGMIEVAWEHQRFAVFERDLKVRGGLVRITAVGDRTPPGVRFKSEPHGSI
jgi:hypothetical protein